MHHLAHIDSKPNIAEYTNHPNLPQQTRLVLQDARIKMQRASAVSDIGTRPRSQGTNIVPNMRHSISSENHKRSRSNTAASMNRPKSRASTTSLHSATTTAENDQQLNIHNMPETPHNGQQMYSASHSGLMIPQGYDHQQRQQGYAINPHMGGPHAHNMQQPTSFAFDNQSMNQQNFAPNPHHAFAIHGDSMPVSYAEFEGLENDSTALDDSELVDPKQKRASTSTQQNEIELKRMLEQYRGRNLKDVALEIQRTDGNGGKSEKVKQVFAMLWLEENCRKSSGSVRRDRVFSCYAKRCGNEAVPTLNPASFGKLVRIIFSDIKTRRLGVRGESKYHYVDLSLVPEAEHDVEDLNEDFLFRPANDVNQQQMRRSQSHQRSLQTPTETADFPLPNMAPLHQEQSVEGQAPAMKPMSGPSADQFMECRYLGQPLITIDTSQMPKAVQDALNQQLPKTSTGSPYLTAYLAQPSQEPAVSKPEESINLPDIHTYLQGENYDPSIADSLSHLYRTYCVCLTDAFRYCKDKTFFTLHANFNGNMTVPVQKLLSHERLAPWVLECDTRMYKRMIGFATPLTTQNVPKAVLDTFNSICSKLVNHLIESFSKTPAHVVVAKIIPAARFVHLLSKLPKVNQLAQSTHALLQTSALRTQMWVDLLQMTDPHALIEEAHFTPDAIPAVANILRHEYKALLTPMDESLASQFENNNVAWTSFLSDPAPTNEHITSSIFDPAELVSSNVIERWIQHIRNLHLHLPHHTPKCIMNHQMALWRGILADLGVNAANSYQCWWQLDLFLTSVLAWEVELAGFGDIEVQIAQDKIEEEKRKKDEEMKKEWDDYHYQWAEYNAYMERLRLAGQARTFHSQDHHGTKRKRDDLDDEHAPRKPTRSTESASTTTSNGVQGPSTAQHSNRSDNQNFDSAANQESHGRPNDNQNIDNNMSDTSPAANTRSKRVKSSPFISNKHNNHDDSGIGLDVGLDEDVDVDTLFNDAIATESSPTGGLSKFIGRVKAKSGSAPGEGGADSWGILSDPADAAGDVVVV